MLLGGFDLALAFAHFGRHPGEAQAFVNFLFGCAANTGVAFEFEQAVLVEREAAAECSLPQDDVVRLAW